MALDLGTSNEHRYLTVSDSDDFTLPDGDWAILALLKRTEDTSGYIVSRGAYNTADSISWYYDAGYMPINVDGVEVSLDVGAAGVLGVDDWALVAARRISGSLSVSAIDANTSTVSSSSSATLTGTSNGGDIYFGAPSTGSNSYWALEGVLQHIGFIDGEVTDAQLIAMANGAPILSMPFAPGMVELWHPKNASSNIVGLIKGHSATKNSTGYADDGDIFPVYPGQIRRINNKSVGEIVLSVSNISHQQSCENIDLVQSGTLVISDSVQSLQFDNVTLLLDYILSVFNTQQDQSSDDLDLIQNYVLTVVSTFQSQHFDNVDLIQNYLLEVNHTEQSQVFDNITLSSDIILALQNAAQSQFLDNIDLIQSHVLIVQDSNQSQIIDNVSLAVGVTLAVAGTFQSQQFDNIALSLSVVLDPHDMTQNHHIDGVVLTHAHMLTVQDILQSQASQNIELTQNSILVVADTIQTQTIDNIQWVVIVTPDHRIYAVSCDSRVYPVS